MEKTPVKSHESSPNSSTKPTNTTLSNPIGNTKLSFNNEIERIYSELITGKTTLTDTNLIPESELLRKFVSLHSPDCLLVKMHLQDFSVSLLKQGTLQGTEVVLQYREWTFFDYLESGHIPPYLFNLLGRSELTLYDGCVIIKLVNCRFRKAPPSKSDTSHPDSCTHYFLLRSTPEIIAHQTNLMLLQSPNLHNQHPYTIRHRALQIESAITQKLAPPLCLDTSPEVLITANFNQFQRFKYNHPRLKRLRRKFAKFNTKPKLTMKQCGSTELRLLDYLANTASILGCKKSRNYSLLGTSMKECMLLKSSSNLLNNIAISRPERAIETAIRSKLQIRSNLPYSDKLNNSQHYHIAKSHSNSLPNNSYRPDPQTPMRRASYPLHYSMNNSLYSETISQFRSFSASTPGTPPVEPFTPHEEPRYPQTNSLETSQLLDSTTPTNSLAILHSQRNSFHTPSSMTSSDIHLRGNQQASMECSTSSTMNDVYPLRHNSHVCEHDKQHLPAQMQSLPKFPNTFPNKVQSQNQFLTNTNKFPPKYYPQQQQQQQQPSYPAGPALPPYQPNSRIPHNIITPNPPQYPMESSLKHLVGNKRHLDSINHITAQAKRYTPSPGPNLPIPNNQTTSMQYQKDIRHTNHMIRGSQQPVNGPTFVSGRKISQNIYPPYSNQLPTHDYPVFNHTSIQNSNLNHTTPHTPVEQSEH